MRYFETGATRDSDETKNDYEGFLDPLVIEAFGDYMTKHREQADGNLRDSDNWQKGIPKAAYMKSKFRHFLDTWKIHRGHKAFDKKTGAEVTIKDSLLSEMFNTMGYLHEVLKEENGTNL